jgi:hypothetical protein
MHPDAGNFIAEFKTAGLITVVEIGSRDINGTVRHLFPNATWTGLDLYAGPAVDVVCNAAEWTPPSLVDMVVCCEVLEHAANWRQLIGAAFRWLKPDGVFLVTCAAPGRAAHSHHDGQLLRDGEYYENLSGKQIAEVCVEVGFQVIQTRQGLYDTYAHCTKEA